MKRLFTVILISAVFVQVTACESPDPGERNARDSAGVQIVEFDGIGNVRLEVAPEPLVEVGTAEGEAAYLFMRPVDAIRLESEAIVVLDAGARELRWFDAAGRHVRTVGGSGSGPGEFVHPKALLALPGDSAAVFDESHLRMSLYDSAGALARTWTVEGPPTASAGEYHYFRPPPFGCLRDGRFLHRASRRAQEAPGHVRRTAVVLAYSPLGEWLGPIVDYTGGDWRVERQEWGERSTQGIGDRRASAATDGDLIYVGNGDTYKVAVYDPSGELRRIIRRQVDPLAADEEQIELALAPLRERIRDLPGDQRAEAERQLRDMANAMRARLSRYSTMPAYRTLDVDAKGRLWVRTGASPVYDVLDNEGHFLGSVELAGEPLEFGSGEVIVRREDELGVPSVAVFKLLESSNN